VGPEGTRGRRPPPLARRVGRGRLGSSRAGRAAAPARSPRGWAPRHRPVRAAIACCTDVLLPLQEGPARAPRGGPPPSAVTSASTTARSTRRSEPPRRATSARSPAPPTGPAPRDEAEWAFVLRHTLIGERILKRRPHALASAAELGRSAHEPGTAAAAPTACRRADPARRTDHLHPRRRPRDHRRPSQPARDQPRGTDRLRRHGGTRFDRAVVAAFVKGRLGTTVGSLDQRPGPLRAEALRQGDRRSSSNAVQPITQAMPSHPVQEQRASGGQVATSVAVARQPIFDRSEQSPASRCCTGRCPDGRTRRTPRDG
jgi:hypothetical protein